MAAAVVVFGMEGKRNVTTVNATEETSIHTKTIHLQTQIMIITIFFLTLQ